MKCSNHQTKKNWGKKTENRLYLENILKPSFAKRFAVFKT